MASDLSIKTKEQDLFPLSSKLTHPVTRRLATEARLIHPSPVLERCG